LERIARSLPGVRLTVTLRKPLEFILLMYAHQNRNDAEPMQPISHVLDTHRWQYFRLWIEPAMYALHLTRLLRHFERDRVKILIYDDLVRDPVAFADDVFAFLGVET